MTAFDGVRVLDLTSGVAGACACMHLGDLGADVVRLVTAGLPPDPPSNERDVARIAARRNTRVATTDAYVEDARRLANRADVVVTDGPLASLEERGLDAPTLLAASARLSHVHLPAYGRRGTGTDLPEDALLLAAVSGVADLHFATEERPVAPVVPFLHYEQGALAATAAAAALVGCQRSGLGRQVTVSGLHAVAFMNVAIMVDAPGIVRLDGPKAPLQGAPNYRAYRCSDGRWLFLGTLTAAFFFRALEVFDAMDVMVLPGVDGDFMALRDPAVRPVAIARLQEIIGRRSRDEWARLLDAAQVPNAPIQTRGEWQASDLVADNDSLVTLTDPRLGPVRLPNVAVELSRTPGRVRGRPDTIGATAAWSDAEPGERRDPASPVGGGDVPLAGVRVIDLGTFLAGPAGPAILCDFGAEVVKVEHPEGDAYRIFTAAYAAINQGKANVSLDLKREADRRRLHAMVADADILVDNVRPGVQETLGTDAATLHALNPNLIRCSVTAWGRSSSTAPAFDPLIQAMSGLMVAQGGPDHPVLQLMPVHDMASATMAAFGALAALYARERIGGGQEARVSLTAASMVIQGAEMTSFAGRPPQVTGGADFAGPDARHRLYRCLDGWVAVAWDDGPSVADVAAGLGDRSPAADLDAALGACSVRDALARLGALHVPAVEALHRTAVFSDPWLLANDFFRTIDDAVIGEVKGVRGYADWGDTVDTGRRRTAGIGEDDGSWRP